MTEKKNKEMKETVMVELKVSMYCKACERSIFQTLFKIEGVESVVTDMAAHRAVVTGKVDPEKVRKRLESKTGKKVKILMEKNEDDLDYVPGGGGEYVKWEEIRGLPWGAAHSDAFSDDNPNACLIM